MTGKLRYLLFVLLLVSNTIFAQQAEPTILQKAALDWIDRHIDSLFNKIDKNGAPSELIKYLKEAGQKNIPYTLSPYKETNIVSFFKATKDQKGTWYNASDKGTYSSVYKLSKWSEDTPKFVLDLFTEKETPLNGKYYVSSTFSVQNEYWGFYIILEFDSNNTPLKYYMAKFPDH